MTDHTVKIFKDLPPKGRLFTKRTDTGDIIPECVKYPDIHGTLRTVFFVKAASGEYLPTVGRIQTEDGKIDWPLARTEENLAVIDPKFEIGF